MGVIQMLLGAPGSPTAPPAPDPYFDDVVLLCGFDGSDGATSAVDESSYGRALTFNGTAQLDTAARVFGSSSSLLLDGSGDYVTALTASELSVQTGDFTIEAWVRRAANGAHHTISNKRRIDSAQEHSLSIFTDEKLYFSMYDSGVSVLGLNSGSETITADGAFHHVAIAREGATVRMFIDGSLVASGDQSGSPSANTAPLYIGRDGFDTSRDFNGWIDEYRFTRVARYTASFTPPSAKFPRT